MAELSKEFQDYMLQHHYGAVALDTTDRVVNQQTIEAKINGKRVTLAVDTGCPRTMLTEACARRLGLTVADTGHEISGVGGKVAGTEGIAAVKSFTLGNCEINRLSTILVMPEAGRPTWGTDGFIGLDTLALNAAIIPIAGSGFLIKPGPVPVVSIRSYMTKLGFAAVPMQKAPGGHATVEGHINDHPLRIAIDSGASFSAFDANLISKILGHSVTSAPLVLEGIDGRQPQLFRFTPSKFDLGGFSLQPITMIAARTPAFKDTGELGLLGYDVMGMHRAVVDLGEHLLWLK